MSVLGQPTRALPHFQVLDMGGAGTPEDDRWKRVYVESPGWLYPYRNDTLTGAALLGFIQITYSPERPIRSTAGFPEGATAFRGFPAGPMGACYLWATGEWWIRIETGIAGNPSLRLPFAFFPAVPSSRVLPFDYARLSSRPPTTFGASVAAAATATVVSCQELLDGMRALDFTASVLGANCRLRWQVAPGGNSHYPVGEPQYFEGPRLPLADLILLNNGAAAMTYHINRYY